MCILEPTLAMTGEMLIIHFPQVLSVRSTASTQGWGAVAMGPRSGTHLHASQGVHGLHLRHNSDRLCLPGGPAAVSLPRAVTRLGQKQKGVNKHVL